jgi:hypothetical protein
LATVDPSIYKTPSSERVAALNKFSQVSSYVCIPCINQIIGGGKKSHHMQVSKHQSINVYIAVSEFCFTRTEQILDIFKLRIFLFVNYTEAHNPSSGLANV